MSSKALAALCLQRMDSFLMNRANSYEHYGNIKPVIIVSVCRAAEFKVQLLGHLQER